MAGRSSNQRDLEFADAEFHGGFVVGHENIEAIVEAFGRSVLDDAFAEAFNTETGAERQAARSGYGDADGGRLTIGGGLACSPTAFRAMAIGGDGVKLLNFGVAGRG